MILSLFFISIAGICAPFDASDCDYTINYYPEFTYAWGKYDPNTKTLYFGGQYWNKRDCWGQTYWEHEWRHAQYGSFHLNGVQCKLRGMYVP